jgi:hypothetical protein
MKIGNDFLVSNGGRILKLQQSSPAAAKESPH